MEPAQYRVPDCLDSAVYLHRDCRLENIRNLKQTIKNTLVPTTIVKRLMVLAVLWPTTDRSSADGYRATARFGNYYDYTIKTQRLAPC